MKLIYTEDELQQRSAEWLAMRKTCIGGSDVAAVLGLNKYESPRTLWRRLTGRQKPKEINAAMLRGAEMEDEAKEAVGEYLVEFEGIKTPTLTQYFAKHPDFNFLGVSFDAVDIKNKYIVELKCPQHSWNFKSVFENGVQEYYYPQVQLQLFISNALWGIDKAYFASYFPDGAYIADLIKFTEELKTMAMIDVDYDPVFCAAMAKVTQEFWNSVTSDTWDKVKYDEVLEEFRRERYENNFQ